MSNIGIFNGAPNAGSTDGELITALNPIAGPDFFTGSDTVGAPVKLAIRSLQAGYQRLGAFTLELLGATAGRWALAPDAGGVPGVWSDWGASLTLPGPITPANTLFWMRSRAGASELAGDDTLVGLRRPDDVTPGAPVGRSWTLPYTIGSVSRVGRSWVLPYTVLAPVGRSWTIPYAVRAVVGRSWELPYAIAAPARTARWIQWEWIAPHQGPDLTLLNVAEIEVVGSLADRSAGPDLLPTALGSWSASEYYGTSPDTRPYKIADLAFGAAIGSSERWATTLANENNSHWVKVDLGSVQTIHSWRIQRYGTYSAPSTYGTKQPKNFKMWVSTLASPSAKVIGSDSNPDWTLVDSGTLDLTTGTANGDWQSWRTVS